MRRHLPFLAVVAGYFLVAGLFAVRVPDWQAPDEPAHYNVVRQIAERGCCPLIEHGDWDSAYLDQIKAAQFAPGLLGSIGDVEYEDHQPPLYYMLLAPVYSLTGGSLTLLRLASVVIGAGVVAAAYAVALRAFRGSRGVALSAAAFVAFLPQHVHILASVNNDALAWALCGAILWACIDHADRGRTPAWGIGLLVGAAFLTKTTAYLMAGVALLALWIGWMNRRQPGQSPATENAESDRQGGYRAPWYAKRYRTLYHAFIGVWHAARGARYSVLGAFAAFLIPALVLGALWWLRNLGVYGVPDFLGLRAHDAVVVGQLRTADYVADIGLQAYLSDALRTVSTSFFGQFGWMGVPLPGWVLAGFLALTGIGLLFASLRLRADRADAKAAASIAWGTWPLFGWTALLSVLMLVYYNTIFVQFQGRYIYPLLLPLAAVVAYGLDYLRRKLPLAARYDWLPAAALGLVAVLDLWLLWRVVVPNLTP